MSPEVFGSDRQFFLGCVAIAHFAAGILGLQSEDGHCQIHQRYHHRHLCHRRETLMAAQGVQAALVVAHQLVAVVVA
jgi:hypothetical protein